MSEGIYKLLTAVIALYAFLVGFVLITCVGMSNADSSPEVSLTFSHPLRSAMLVALVAWPFATMVAVGQRAPWGTVLLIALCLCVATVGMICATSDHGAFESFSAVGALRRGTGRVYVSASLIVLALALFRAREDLRRHRSTIY